MGENWDDEQWLGIRGVPNIGFSRYSVVKENRKPRNLVLNSVASTALGLNEEMFTKSENV